VEHIQKFYANIYKPPPQNDILPPDCIKSFLGPDICNNPIVTGSKLTDEEKNFFDTPMSIQELDKAVQELNPSSAGGADGISTKFLRKFWGLLRVPFFN
jgi:hypothetical protein